MKWIAAFVLTVIASMPVAAQRDFLTPDEADQLREAQEPDLRLKLYLTFAQTRIDMLQQFFGKQQAGRSAIIHDTLEQYTKIIDAMDTVIDEALRKQKGLEAIDFVAKAEREMLAKLQKFAEVKSPDADRWEFALEQALETTKDSAEMSEADIQDRRREAETKAVDEKKKAQEMMTPERKAEAVAGQKKQAEADQKAKKRPSLLKPGETVGGPATPPPPAKKQ